MPFESLSELYQFIETILSGILLMLCAFLAILWLHIVDREMRGLNGVNAREKMSAEGRTRRPRSNTCPF